MTDEPTLTERLEYLDDMVKLKLWFTRRWLTTHPAEDVRTVLRRRIDIYRRTDLYDGRPLGEVDLDAGPWLQLEQRLADLHEHTLDDPDAARFETEGLAIFRDRIETYARQRFAKGWDTGLRNLFSYGSLRFDPPPPANPRRATLHIANVLCPASIFDDPGYLPRCLRELMARARDAFGADSLGTGTWLNSDPRWLAVFGGEWAEHMAPPMTDVSGNMGWWGQFVNARGTFNHKRADQFRRTGAFPYVPRESWCSFASLQHHLATLPNPDR